MSEPLPGAFYDRDTRRVARDLLGCLLIRTVDGRRMAGRIVETEAYLGEADLACHSARGRTDRTEVMYGPPGRAYVYLIYGVYWCLNAVTREAGAPQAVLIRAIAPTEGLDEMRQRRCQRRSGKIPSDRDLTNGPGKLCQAMAIDRRLNGRPLWDRPLQIAHGTPVPDDQVSIGPRIGVDYAGPWKARPWRYWVKDDTWVSR